MYCSSLYFSDENFTMKSGLARVTVVIYSKDFIGLKSGKLILSQKCREMFRASWRVHLEIRACEVAPSVIASFPVSPPNLASAGDATTAD